MIKNLQQKRRLKVKNKLIQLNPYLDQKKVLRSRSRHEFSPTRDGESRHRLILTAAHPTAHHSFYLQHPHQVCMHRGLEYVKSFVHLRYHIIGIRQALRSIAHHCFLCRRYKGGSIQIILAPVPPKRYPDENNISHSPTQE